MKQLKLWMGVLIVGADLPDPTTDKSVAKPVHCDIIQPSTLVFSSLNSDLSFAFH